MPGRPAAFLETVRLGVVEDELVALHKIRPAILVMPFGSTGSFTDEEWANGVRPHSNWETFVARDLVRAVDARYRTIRRGSARALAGLSEGGYGALNIGLHHPGEFGVLESWSGYQRADPIRSIFGIDRSLLARNSPSLTLGTGGGEAAACAHLRLVLQRHRRPLPRAEHGLRRGAAPCTRIPFRYFVVRGGPQLGHLARQRGPGA